MKQPIMERTTAVLLDEYDETLRRIVAADTKRQIAARLRQQSGILFAQSLDGQALELRSQAETLEKEAEPTHGLQTTLGIIYDIVRERHEHDND